jgi:hypothetical protein
MTGIVAGLGVKAAESAALDRTTGIISIVPKPVWEALAVIGYAAALLFLHQHYAHAAISAADKAGYARAKEQDAKALDDLKKRAAAAITNGAAISQDTRSKNDAQAADIRSTAGALSVRGPGAARCGCVDHSAVPAASSQPIAADRQSDAAGSAVSAADRATDVAGVPWQWLVGRAEQCDLDRAESLSWRDWYAREAAEWAKLNEKASK